MLPLLQGRGAREAEAGHGAAGRRPQTREVLRAHGEPRVQPHRVPELVLLLLLLLRRWQEVLGSGLVGREAWRGRAEPLAGGRAALLEGGGSRGVAATEARDGAPARELGRGDGGGGRGRGAGQQLLELRDLLGRDLARGLGRGGGIQVMMVVMVMVTVVMMMMVMKVPPTWRCWSRVGLPRSAFTASRLLWGTGSSLPPSSSSSLDKSVKK